MNGYKEALIIERDVINPLINKHSMTKDNQREWYILVNELKNKMHYIESYLEHELD